MTKQQERLWSVKVGGYVRVVERQRIFGRDVITGWSEDTGQVVTEPANSFLTAPPARHAALRSLLGAAYMWNVFQEQALVAPIVSRVLPLPHQFRVLRLALERYPVRMLLADEVGLGKTIEAGLVMKELIWRGDAARILVVAPKSLLLQWQAEMAERFGERFDIVIPSHWEDVAGDPDENLWNRYSRVLVSFDSVKPRGESNKRTDRRGQRRNLRRFHDLVAAGWDLVVIDECHRVAGTTDDVARHELAKALAETAPNLLLLSATPHSGKSDPFLRLVGLLSKEAALAVRHKDAKNKISRFVVRTDKRTVTDEDGRALFAPRSTTLVSVPFEEEHEIQERLFKAVSEYVRSSYNRSRGRSGSRLLLLLIQRLMSSSTHAVQQFLERRLVVLTEEAKRESQSVWDAEFDEEDADEALQMALIAPELFRQEVAEVRSLLELATQTEAAGPDVRALALYDHMLRMAREEGDSGVKFLIFTEFRATQEMLAQFLAVRGYEVATLHGGMGLAERQVAQQRFQQDAQVLISTDAGGEGLNLQFAHLIFNYDLPWNPMRVEQRIGRVDRIGQKQPVRAINLVLENSIEARLYEVWIEKLAAILREFGVDKTSDVLDSQEAGPKFEELARLALVQPDRFDSEAEKLLADVRRQARQAQEARAEYVETLDYHAEKTERAPAPLRWLTEGQAGQVGKEVPLSDIILEKMAALRADYSPEQALASWRIHGMGFIFSGWFSLWQAGIAGGDWRSQSIFPVCVSNEGRSVQTTARRLWDALASDVYEIAEQEEIHGTPIDMLRQFADIEGAAAFERMVKAEQERKKRKETAIDCSAAARLQQLRKAANPEWETLRRDQIESSLSTNRNQREQDSFAPQLRCLCILKVDVE